MAYAIYYRLLDPIPITESGSLREVDLTIPSDCSWNDQYTVNWKGSYILQSLLAPNGEDILHERPKYWSSGLEWGFVYVSFNPQSLAYGYAITGAGIWRIRMEAIDPSTPSLYDANEPRVSLHYNQYISYTASLRAGESYVVNRPLTPLNWYDGAGTSFYINVSADDIDVSGAILQYSYSYTSDSKLYSYSYWSPYDRTIKLTARTPLNIQMSCVWNFFRCVDFKVERQGLKFSLDVDMMPNACNSLDITSTKPLPSSVLHVHNGSSVESLYQVQNEQYSTPGITYSPYKLSFDPSIVYRMIGNDVYGTWTLRTYPIANFTCSPKDPIVGETITFEGMSSVLSRGSMANYVWDFGDGSQGMGAICSHSYTKAGQYNITLKVTDDKGSSDMAWATIQVLIHDITVKAVTVPTGVAYVGVPADISVILQNNGNFTETFSVIAYANATAIDIKSVASLAPGSNYTLVFTWNTKGVAPGDYIMRAEASAVSRETDVANNGKEGGAVQLRNDYRPPDISFVTRSPMTPEYFDPVIVDANITDDESGVAEVILTYWDGSEWKTSEMLPQQGTYRATIPSLPYGITVQYKVITEDRCGNSNTSETISYITLDRIAPEISGLTISPAEPSSGLFTRDEVSVTVEVSEPANASGIGNVALWLRINRGEWQRVPMRQSDNAWSSTIPATNAGTLVEYYVESFDNAGNRETTMTDSYTTKSSFQEILIYASAGAILLVILVYAVKRRKG